MAESVPTVDSLAEDLNGFLDSPAAWGRFAPELMSEWTSRKVAEEGVDQALCGLAVTRVIERRFRRC